MDNCARYSVFVWFVKVAQYTWDNQAEHDGGKFLRKGLKLGVAGIWLKPFPEAWGIDWRCFRHSAVPMLIGMPETWKVSSAPPLNRMHMKMHFHVAIHVQ